VLIYLALAAAAFLCGVTGTWSPCGFSSIDTIAGMAPRRWTLASSCLAFAAGSLAGGAATFGLLGVVGSLVPGSGGRGAAAAAAIAAVAAAVAEVRALRIAPQIRRQVPEPWRRRLPLPLAAGLYGALLGLGFATFVLTFGVWALAAVALALGDPATGVVVGLAFGLGRAVPVVVLAPLLDRPLGRRIAETMAERPVLLRRFRFADGVALLACAAALAAGRAAAATTIARSGSDPSTAGGALAWQAPRTAIVEDAPVTARGTAAHHLGALTRRLPGRNPALGGSLLAWRDERTIRVVRRATWESLANFTVRGADALAVSNRWVVYRLRRAGAGDRIAVRPLGRAGRERTVVSVKPPAQIGRPAIDGDRVVFHVAGLRVSELVEADLRTGRRRVLRRSTLDQLTNPSLLGSALLYVRVSNLRQALVLGRVGPGHDRVIYSLASTAVRDEGHEPGYSSVTRTPPAGMPATRTLWTTALAASYAYLTLVPLRAPAGAEIVRVPR
jgi:hypothetical protein